MLSQISAPAILISQASLPEEEKFSAPSIFCLRDGQFPRQDSMVIGLWVRIGEGDQVRSEQSRWAWAAWPTESRATYMFVVLAAKLWVGLLVLKATYREKFSQGSDVWIVLWRMIRRVFFCYFNFFFWKVSLGEWSRTIWSLFCLHVGLIMILRQPSYPFL